MSKSKNNAEERVRVVEACISGRLGLSEAARQAEVDESTIMERDLLKKLDEIERRRG